MTTVELIKLAAEGLTGNQLNTNYLRLVEAEAH